MNDTTQNRSGHVPAFGLSLALVSILSSILVLIKEKNEGVMAMMKAATGHHWITHGMIVLGLFVVLGFVFAKMPSQEASPERLNSIARTIVIATLISGLILAVFNLIA